MAKLLWHIFIGWYSMQIINPLPRSSIVLCDHNSIKLGIVILFALIPYPCLYSEDFSGVMINMLSSILDLSLLLGYFRSLDSMQ